MASGAARWLALVRVGSGASRSWLSLRKGGDVSAGRSCSGLCESYKTKTNSFKAILAVASLHKMSFGLLRVFSIVIPFLYVGTLISKNFAALLEEHDIFVPEDDDDDD
nr:PREDICTED: essential MCU regulator, mitochondrial isoform X2 [Bos mutus]